MSQKLSSWKRPIASHPNRWKGMALLLLFFSALATFAYCLMSPFDRPDFRLVVISPAPLETTSGSTGAAIPRDLAGRVACASQLFLEQGVRRMSEAMFIPNKKQSLANISPDFEHDLKSTIHPQTTLLVYVVGVLSMDRVEPALCSTTRDAIHAGGHLDIVPLIDRLKQIQCRQVVLCIDACLPSSHGPEIINASIIEDQLREKIESHIVDGHSTPIAVHLRLQGTDDAMDRAELPSDLAMATLSAIQRGAMQRTISLDEFQQAIASSSSNRRMVVEEKTAWLASTNWPLERQWVQFPQAALDVLEEPQVRLTDLEKQASTSDSSPVLGEVLAKINESDPKQMVALYGDILMRMKAHPIDTDRDGFLRFPQQPSCEQVCPIAYHLIKQDFLEWRAGVKNNDEGQDFNRLRATLKALESVYAGQPVQQDAPEWVQWASKCLAPSWKVQGKGLVAERTLECMGWSQLLTSQQRLLLKELLRRTIEEKSAVGIGNWIEALGDEEKEYAEMRWAAQVLEHHDLPWEVQQDLLRSRFLSDRLAADPMTWIQDREAMEHGDLLRMTAERMLVDRSQPRFRNIIQTNVRQSVEVYQSILLRVNALRANRIAYDSLVSNIGSARPWNQSLSSGTREREKVSLQFANLLQLNKLIATQGLEFEQLKNAKTESRLSALGDLPGLMVSFNKEKPSLVRAKRVDEELQATTDVSETVEDLEHFRAFWCNVIGSDFPNIAAEIEREIALAKNALSSFAKTPEQRIQTLSRFDHAMTRIFEALIDSLVSERCEVPRSSSIWHVAAEASEHNRLKLLKEVSNRNSDARKVIRENMSRLMRMRQGATEFELASFQVEWEGWDQRLMALGGKVERVEAPTFEIRSPERLDLTLRESATLMLLVKAKESTSKFWSLTPHYDADSIELQMDRAKLVPETSSRCTLEFDREGIAKINLSIRRLASVRELAPVVIYIGNDVETHRVVIDLDGTNNSMVDLSCFSCDRVPSNEALELARFSMFPNRSNAITMVWKNRLEHTVNFKGRVLLVQELKEKVPSGALSSELADRWLAQFGEKIVSVPTKPASLSSGESQPIRFDPAPWPDDKPRPAFQHMVIEVTNENESKVEYFDCIPHVIRPKNYVLPHVLVDSQQRTVSVELQSLSEKSLPGQGVQAEVELYDGSLVNPDGSPIAPIARSRFLLKEGDLRAQSRLSSARCRSTRGILVLRIDDWPGSFVYDLDLSQNGQVEPTEKLESILVRQTANSDIVQSNGNEVEAEVEAVMTDSAFANGSDSILVGIDVNLDRKLEGEACVRLDSPISIAFAWNGIDATGAMQINPVVRPFKVRLPVQLDWDRRAPILAVFQRGSSIRVSHSDTLIFDRVAPLIRSAKIVGNELGTLGLPIQFEIQIDEQGLSGGAAVEGGWSLNGELAMREGFKAIPAIYREQDRWLLSVPTENMPSGNTVLLVRAVDRAGNHSKTFSMMVELLTKEEQQSRAAKVTTFVEGEVTFGKIPQPGLRVELFKSNQSDASPEGKEKAQEPQSGKPEATQPKPLASSETSADGRFRFNGIPSGKYKVEVNGIVRGMREKRTLDLEVQAPMPPPRLLLRLEKRP